MIQDTDNYRSVQRTPLYQQIAQQIEERIRSNELSPGDMLPSETELAAQVGASRTAVREAIKALSARGLVDIQQGKGSCVTALTSETATQPLSLFIHQSSIPLKDLFEIRTILEAAMAFLAGERATPPNVERMQKALDAMERTQDDREEYIRADLDFHTAMAEATQNRLFTVLLRPLVALLREAMSGTNPLPESYRHAHEYHREILECLRARNATGARRAIVGHLEQARNEMEELGVGDVRADMLTGD